MVEIDHIAALVDNLERVINILTEGFGFRAGPISDVPTLGIRNVFLEGENVKIELIEPIGPGAYRELAQKGFIGFNHIALSVEDFDSVLEKLNRVGVRPKGEVVQAARGSVWDIDPDTTSGVRLQLFKKKSGR